MPVASIIIPHLNGRHHLDDCFQSLRQQTFTDFEVILVDNGSSDGTQAYVREQFPEVRLLELGQNRGFTGACNAGWRAASGEFIILLNNDTEVAPDWLANVVDAFERHPEVGSIASKMLLFDKRDHLHTAGDFVRVDGIPGNRGVWQKDEGQFDREEYVFSACGGSAAYRQTMLAEIGFLDDDFFFSCEDVDMGWRVNLVGWRVLYVPTAVLYHKLKATGGDVTGSYYDGRNFLYLIWKNYPGSLLRRHWRLILRAQWRITQEALRHWRGEAARARLRGQAAGLLGIFKMWPKRRAIQVMRRIDDETLTARLTPVDDPSGGG
ncbi:MAG: glycosyltransferase family 2 protein [Ardenticatenaceae bacterium]|nr:glycosyltransferase family 2 protein [Anaerolineales bacterium]MCB8922928.1 glycosyltransferase family 2 protein [Ardenticatenaceae bacterium]MCB8990336.1 glycosyltransferase family 2 protein [Ardenticatenaceae bacterium]MCB9005229.1 glycosyltransferase family 2 protein [Ardenticatenaceae bacterium]